MKSFNGRSFLWARGLLACSVTLLAGGCCGYKSCSMASSQQTYQEADSASVASRCDDVSYEINNCSAEVSRLTQKTQHLEDSLDEVRSIVCNQESSDQSAVLQDRLNKLDASLQAMTADLRQLKDHSNENAKVLGEYRKALMDFEKDAAAQNNRVAGLEEAMRSLTDCVQQGGGRRVSAASAGNEVAMADGAAASGKASAYRVKPGDTLGKIAKEHKTTIQAIKLANGLKEEDRILVGQQIVLP